MSRHHATRILAAIVLTCNFAAVPSSRVAGDSVIGHWPLDRDTHDASPHALPTLSHDVAWGSLAGAVFNGRSAFLEVPAATALRLGTNDFTVALWVKLDAALDDSPGDLVTLFDAAARNGFNLTVQHQSGTCSSMANTRNLFFGLDAGTEPRWADRGRPGNSLMVYALTVFNGALYAGTFEHGAQEAGHVYRYAGGTNWVGCGRAGPLQHRVSARSVQGRTLRRGHELQRCRLASQALAKHASRRSRLSLCGREVLD